MGPIPIILTPEELALIQPFSDLCNARSEGFRQGMEAAKEIAIRQILGKRTNPEESKAPVKGGYVNGVDHAQGANQ